jgi:transposase
MFLGIDIAKSSFEAASLDAEGKSRQKCFENNPQGFAALENWIGSTSAPACMEATGTYSEALALYLHERGFRVSVVNPAVISAFRQSQMKRAKTDKEDALLMARYCQMYHPVPWTPPAQEVRELQCLVRRLEALDEMYQMESNRLQAGGLSSLVVADLQEHLTYLESRIVQTKQAISQQIDQHPTLRSQRDLLTSIPGIAEATAARLLAELGDISQFTGAPQVAAFAGLVPRICQSGTSVCRHASLSKVGSGRLRKALYFPAMVALRFNPPIRALGERLRAKGKNKMLILGAAMRKLLHIVYGVLKSGNKFDPGWANSA